MNNLKQSLQAILNNAKRVVILGVGSEIRSDDAVGMIIARKLASIDLSKAKIPVNILLGSTAPENFTGEIKKFNPSHLIMIDCAFMGKNPGEAALIDIKDEKGGIPFSTHKLPLILMDEYLKQSIDCETVTLGIEPKSTEYGETQSQEILEAADMIVELLVETLTPFPPLP